MQLQMLLVIVLSVRNDVQPPHIIHKKGAR